MRLFLSLLLVSSLSLVNISTAEAIEKPSSNSGTSNDPKGTSSVLYLAYQGPLTGSEESLGQSQLAAVKFAVSRYNLLQSSPRVELILGDDQGDETIAANIASDIASNKAILGVIGPAYSATTVASLPFYKTAGLALISPSASRPSLTDRTSSEFGGPIFHRVVGTDSAQGQALAKLATNGNKAAKVFIVDDQYQYSVNLAGYVTSALKKVTGASLVGTDSIPNTTTDFATTIAKIKNGGADVVIYTGYYNLAAEFINQLRESGSKALFSGGDGVFFPDFLKLAGAAAEGARIIGSPVLEDISPALEAEYLKSTGVSSDALVAPAIDATNVFLSGITAGARSRAEMLSFVKSKNGTRVSLTGKDIFFDDKGDLIDPDISSFIVSNGRFKYLKPGFELLSSTDSAKVDSDRAAAEKKAKQEADAKAAADKQDAKKLTIKCVKGKVTKTITGETPQCPKGYKNPLDAFLTFKAFSSCKLYKKDFLFGGVTLEDGGKTLTFSAVGKYTFSASAPSYSDVECALGVLKTPSFVKTQIQTTRALDGMQKATWGKISAQWTYHPDNGINISFNSK